MDHGHKNSLLLTGGPTLIYVAAGFLNSNLPREPPWLFVIERVRSPSQSQDQGFVQSSPRSKKGSPVRQAHVMSQEHCCTEFQTVVFIKYAAFAQLAGLVDITMQYDHASQWYSESQPENCANLSGLRCTRTP